MDLLSSTQNTKNKPWAPAGDLMRKVLKQAEKKFTSGDAAMVNKLPSMVEYGKDSDSALTGLSALAGANSAGVGMGGHLQDIMSGGGFSKDQQRNLGAMEDLANNSRLTEMTNSADGLTADQRLVQDRSRGIMNSEFDIDQNPAYALVRERALKEAQMGIDAQAAKAGRYGGASSQTIAARERGNLAADMDMGEYKSWQQRGDAHAQGLAALAGVGVGQRSGAIAQKSGLQSTLFNAQQAGLDNMSKAFQTAQQPYLAQRAVGQERDAFEQSKRNDQIRQFQESDPFNVYQKYMSLASGTPTSSTQTVDPSLAQLLTGGAFGLAALGKAF